MQNVGRDETNSRLSQRHLNIGYFPKILRIYRWFVRFSVQTAIISRSSINWPVVIMETVNLFTIKPTDALISQIYFG